MLWWPIVVGYGRKMALALITALFDFVSIYIPTCIFLVLFPNVIGVLSYRPYVRATDNRIEVSLLSFALFSYLIYILSTIGGAFFASSLLTTIVLWATVAGHTIDSRNVRAAITGYRLPSSCREHPGDLFLRGTGGQYGPHQQIERHGRIARLDLSNPRLA